MSIPNMHVHEGERNPYMAGSTLEQAYRFTWTLLSEGLQVYKNEQEDYDNGQPNLYYADTAGLSDFQRACQLAKFHFVDKILELKETDNG